MTKDSDVTFVATSHSHDNRPNSFQVGREWCVQGGVQIGGELSRCGDPGVDTGGDCGDDSD